MSLKSVDSKVYELIKAEQNRQSSCISLIASENIASLAVREAVGSLLTNKYAEGYPDKRYYGGCFYHDQIENIAIERAKELFGVEHANVQPHCGSSANFASYFALANAGDTILAMDLDHGGHLTHGSKVNFSGKLFNFVSYGVRRDDQVIDYDFVNLLAQKHAPKIIIAGASAYSRIIDFARFRKIADDCGAYLLVDMAHIAGLVAAGVHPSPVPFAHIVTSTTHKTLRGPRGGIILCKEEFHKKIDSLVFPGFQGGPLMHEIAGKAVCFKEAFEPEFKTYQQNVVKNAQVLANCLKDAGFSLVSGKTENHLILLDLTNEGITGKEAEYELDQIGIVANKNKIPYDTTKPTITSGLRLGTPAITSRGMLEKEVTLIAEIIVSCLRKKDSSTSLKDKLSELTQKFPNRVPE